MVRPNEEAEDGEARVVHGAEEGRAQDLKLVEPDELYRAMRSGVRVTTAQASVFERHQSYQSVLGRHERSLYLCVGSVYTGNHAVVSAWKRDHDPDDRLAVVDTGLASGRLGVAVRATARFARETADADAVIRFARAAAQASGELIFLDRLHYLAPATTLGSLAIAAALLVGETDTQSRIKGVLVAGMVVMLWIAWRYLHRIALPTSWPWVLGYSVGIAAASDTGQTKAKSSGVSRGATLPIQVWPLAHTLSPDFTSASTR